ncbi:MAG: cadmium carbonic anhydrase [Gammaproteobacteria bacterium]|nr:cadmium carbonic anhydrase [Gammaproteobacteria bacterium]
MSYSKKPLRLTLRFSLAVVLALSASSLSFGAELCTGYGPQSPRDISSLEGINARIFTPAPPSAEMNLCNIHLHRNAEHKGPGFSKFAGSEVHGGYQCNDTGTLTENEMLNPNTTDLHFKGVAPNDTIEVHWVFSSCDVSLGAGLDACSSETCLNPELRVETQVFLVANDSGDSMLDYGYGYNSAGGTIINGYHQPKALPSNTGTPVIYTGSTTGPSFTEAACSPFQVTWSVRPQCAKVKLDSVLRWGASDDTIFDEDETHGVRQLVTAPELLSKIE